jgi:hypothetical protein
MTQSKAVVQNKNNKETLIKMILSFNVKKTKKPNFINSSKE